MNAARPLLLACLFLLACSSSDDGSEPSHKAQSLLIGKWFMAGNVCNLGAVFNDESGYEIDVVCLLSDGTYGIEAEVGSYGATDNILDLVPELASCFLGDRNYTPYSLSYTVGANALRLATPSGLTVMDRISSDPAGLGTGTTGGGISARYGCAEDDGFVFGELEPVN
jgi:hypothetical protein